MTRDEAFTIVKEYVKNESLVKHMLSVEAAMRFYAEKLGEIHPTIEEHPVAGEPILRQRGVPEDIIHAIMSHADHTGIKRETLMERGLYACDEVTGLITAVALVRPSRSLLDLESSSVKKKWKDRAFAAGANREEIQRAAEEFNVELWEHISNVIHAMRKIAPELGLVGNIQ